MVIDVDSNNEDVLGEGECSLSNCIESEGHAGPHSFQLGEGTMTGRLDCTKPNLSNVPRGKADPICALCGEETDDDFFCYGCRNHVCDVCDTYGRAPLGFHDLDDHVEHEESE